MCSTTTFALGRSYASAPSGGDVCVFGDRERGGGGEEGGGDCGQCVAFRTSTITSRQAGLLQMHILQ